MERPAGDCEFLQVVLLLYCSFSKWVLEAFEEPHLHATSGPPSYILLPTFGGETFYVLRQYAKFTWNTWSEWGPSTGRFIRKAIRNYPPECRLFTFLTLRVLLVAHSYLNSSASSQQQRVLLSNTYIFLLFYQRDIPLTNLLKHFFFVFLSQYKC